MNKQELIDELKKLLAIPSEVQGHNYGLRRAIALTKQLDEPEKPVVPKFVADWYEEHKDNFEYSIQCLCVQGCEPVRQIDIWFDNDDNKPIETFVKMKLFGYEVEKEKLYRVCIADNLVINDTLTQNKDSGIFSFSIGDDSESELFTKTKLEQSGFGWVFDCNGMKVEEVEWKE